MPTFSNLQPFNDHKSYIPLLKKALLTVKPDTERKFLYFKQFPFGQKKAPLVLVDYDPNCQTALAKGGHKPTAEGLVSLTKQNELNFEHTKGELKRISIRNYFGMMGGGIKPVFVPPGEKDDDAAAAIAAMGPATAPTASATTTDPAGQAKDVLARIEVLRGRAFAPSVDKAKVLDKAKELVQANKLASATVLLDKLASNALPAADTKAPAAAGGAKAVDLSALKWGHWYRETPVWPEALTKATWDKNKNALAKMTLSTGLGEQFKTCEAAFGAAVAKMPVLKGDAAADIAKSTKECQAFMADATMKGLSDGLKTLRDLARKTAADALIAKSTGQFCNDVASAADALMNSCQASWLKICLDSATNANRERINLNKAWRLDDLKAEKDPAKRIALSQKLLEQNPDRSPQRDQVEDILAQALKEQGVAKSKDAYAAQMKDDKNKFQPKNLQQKATVIDPQKLKEIMKKTGLNEGEVMSIRAYTAANYTHINPAIANQKDRTDKIDPVTGQRIDWMDTMNKPKGGKALATYETGSASEKGSKKSYYEEGALHAGMIAEAFKKLPKVKRTLYRGARMSPEEFRETYKVGQEIIYEAFVSQSTDQKTARLYATGTPSTSLPRNATTSVYVIATVDNARDIREISIFENDEEELLVPPGTKLLVESIKDDPQQDPGSPTATEWKIVTLKQVQV